VREGDELRFRGGARILVLNPPSARSSCQRSGGKDFTGARRRTYNSTESPAMEDSNDNSLVMKFIFENSSILFSGDITRKTIERILSYDDLLKSDVLKAPHHGSFGGDEKIMKIFLGKVAPKIRVVSKGQNGPRKKDTGIQGNDISSSSTKSYETNQSGAVVVKMGANFCESEGVIKK
jgi:competence protein ComEC